MNLHLNDLIDAGNILAEELLDVGQCMIDASRDPADADFIRTIVTEWRNAAAGRPRSTRGIDEPVFDLDPEVEHGADQGRPGLADDAVVSDWIALDELRGTPEGLPDYIAACRRADEFGAATANGD